MHLHIGGEFVHVATAPVHAVLQVEPRRDTAVTIVREVWDNDPPDIGHTYLDSYGNLCRRLTIPEGRSSLRYDAIVDVDDAADPQHPEGREISAFDLPSDTLPFTLPSRYCPSDQLADEAWSRFGGIEPGWTRVQAICDWVHESITFGYDATSPLNTAVEVFESRAGVCRDFAHLAVTFCRAFSIPTRYVFGYLPDIGVPPADHPMDFCTWIEVYLDDRWWTFDPRNNQPRVGRVLIGRGRDALDVAMTTAFGGVELEHMVVHAELAAA